MFKQYKQCGFNSKSVTADIIFNKLQFGDIPLCSCDCFWNRVSRCFFTSSSGRSAVTSIELLYFTQGLWSFHSDILETSTTTLTKEISISLSATVTSSSGASQSLLLMNSFHFHLLSHVFIRCSGRNVSSIYAPICTDFILPQEVWDPSVWPQTVMIVTCCVFVTVHMENKDKVRLS